MSTFRPHALLRHRWLAGVLALALLVAQTAGLLHKLDFEAHPAGVTCATCVVHGHADTPLSASLADAVALAPLPASFNSLAVAPVQLVRPAARARGPPSLV